VIDLVGVAQVVAGGGLRCSSGQAGGVCSEALVFGSDRMRLLSEYHVAAGDD